MILENLLHFELRLLSWLSSRRSQSLWSWFFPLPCWETVGYKINFSITLENRKNHSILHHHCKNRLMQFSRHFLPSWLRSNKLFICGNESSTSKDSPVVADAAALVFARTSEASLTDTNSMSCPNRGRWR